MAFIAAQLVLVALLLRELDMLTPAFRHIVYLCVPGFLVHHFLPARIRIPFFVLLSIGSLLLVLGTPPDAERFWDVSLALPRTGLLLAVGAILIALCHLPIGFWARCGVVALAGLGIAAFRSGLLPSGGLEIVWILLPAFFMFRIIVYLYDLGTSPLRPTWSQSAAYFFLLPNVCSTLFPVIDFKTFVRSHYNSPALQIYQRGVAWIFRGVVQLLIYRYIDQLYPIRATAVDSGTDLLKYILTNSFLYLNVSGQFHLIIGLLLLFGFNLPETNHLYFLAESFTDYWRRVNIYWKDFILKIFYYPVYFRLKKRPTLALVIATLWAFFVTWLLHLYQTWWLKGRASATWPDTLFWLILGVLILFNSLWEMKRGRQRTLAGSSMTPSAGIGLCVRTAVTFASISLLWSLWSSPTVSVWLGLWKHANWVTWLGGAAVLVAVMGAKFFLEIRPRLRRSPAESAAVESSAGFHRDLWRCAMPIVALLVLVSATIRGYLPDPHLERVQPGLNSIMLYGILEAGDSFPPKKSLSDLNYYQQLTSVDEGNRQLWETYINLPISRTVPSTRRPITDVTDFRMEIMTPLSPLMTVYETDDFQTNRWGMRDRDYELAKAPGTLRIAMLGSSHTMGYAVKRSEVFEHLLEERLNQDPPKTHRSGKFEVLNFSHVLYGPLNQISVLQQQVEPFHPDIVILVGHLLDPWFVNYNIRTMAKRRNPLPPNLTTILESARFNRSLHDGLAEKRMKPFESEIIDWSFAQIVAECRAMNAIPVYFFLPAPGLELPLTEKRAAQALKLKQQAADAGFLIWDGTDTFANQNLNELITGIIPHSNPRAHALIADQLYRYFSGDSALRTALDARAHENSSGISSRHDD